MANPDLEKILTLLLDTARGMLQAHGEFLPFAGVLDQHGRLSLLDAEPPEELIDVPTFVEAMQLGLRRAAQNGDIHAAGVAADVHVQLPEAQRRDATTSSDAISVQLEHHTGECFDVFLPYTAQPGRPLEFGEAFAVLGEARIFGLVSPLPN